MNIEQAISKVVRHNMISHDLKVKDISSNAGLCAQTVSNQLSGRTAWSIERLYKFGAILGISGSDLLANAEKMVKEAEASK